MNSQFDMRKDCVINTATTTSKYLTMSEQQDDMDEEFNDIDEHIQRSPQKAPEPVVEPVKKPKVYHGASAAANAAFAAIPDLPELTRKDKSLAEVLDLMDGDFAPIIPDAVTDYYLAKNGFESLDIKIKRLLALATQKFISDLTQDAYEYSRIRNSSAVYNSSNPQVRAKQLLQGQQYAQQGVVAAPGAEGEQQQGPTHSTSNAGNQQGKIVLTMDDLSSALSEYGMNTGRPDFYR